MHDRSDLGVEVARVAAVQQEEAFKYSQQPGVAGERLELKGGDAVRYDDNNHANDDVGITYAFYLKYVQPVKTMRDQVEPSREGSVAQGALAQAVQEHREWVKFDNMTQEHGPALPREFFVLFLISLPSFQPWIPEPEFALLAAESELGLSWGASCGILQILQVEYRNSSRSLT